MEWAVDNIHARYSLQLIDESRFGHSGDCPHALPPCLFSMLYEARFLRRKTWHTCSALAKR